MKNTAEGRKTKVSNWGCWEWLLQWGSGGRQELGPALSGSWQNGFSPGESSGEVMPWWNLERVQSYPHAKDWRRKGSKWSVISADAWEAVEGVLTDSWVTVKCLEIRAQAESVCKHGWKLGYSMRPSRSVSGTLCPVVASYTETGFSHSSCVLVF